MTTDLDPYDVEDLNTNRHRRRELEAAQDVRVDRRIGAREALADDLDALEDEAVGDWRER